MNYYIRKIYFSLFLSLLIVLTCFTTTFAFISSNRNVTVDKFSLNIGGSGDDAKKSGLVLSIDGVNFSDTLSELDIKKAILKSRGYNINNMTTTSINNIYNKEVSLLDVTPNNYLDLAEGFTTIDKKYLEKVSKGYISLDIYVSTENENYTNGNYLPVYFSDDSMTENTKNITTDILVDVAESHPTLNKIPRVITMNATNACRVGVITYETMDKGVVSDTKELSSQIYRFDDNKCSVSNNVYNFGGLTPKFRLDEDNNYYQVDTLDESYNDESNLVFNSMQKYYNTIMEEKISDSSFNLDNVKNRDTYDKYIYKENIIDTSFKLTYDKMIKLKVYIWIEGWDSDCFNAIVGSNINLSLLFTTYSIDVE